MPDAGGVFYSGHIADEPFLAAPIVLLHGAGGSRLDWAMRRLPGRVVIAIDLPGHGALIDQPGRSTIADYTAVVVDSWMLCTSHGRSLLGTVWAVRLRLN